MKTYQDIIWNDRLFEDVELDIDYCKDLVNDTMTVTTATINFVYRPIHYELFELQDCCVFNLLTHQQQLDIIDECEDDYRNGL